jgi:hypothetical protein
LAGKPKGKRPQVKPSCRWKDNMSMDLREIVWDGEDWMHVSQDRDQWWALLNVIMNLQVP